MLRKILQAFICLVLVTAAPAADEGDYISRLETAVQSWKADLPVVRSTASRAAKAIIAEGGTLYAAGDEESFLAEGTGRAGGLAGIQRLTPTTVLKPSDVVLIGSTAESTSPSLEALCERVQRAGAFAIVFWGGKSQSGENIVSLPAKASDQSEDIRSVSNIIGFWTWVGEFISCSMPQGKMPCILESIWMPGGMARDKVIGGKMFHTIVPPKGQTSFGLRYLELTEQALGELKKVNKEAFKQAIALIRETQKSQRPVSLMTIGHMFPDEFKYGPTPSWMQPAPSDFVPSESSLPLFLGYQPFPWDVPQLTSETRVPSIIVSVRGPTPDWVQDAQHVYINPCWPVSDAAVSTPEYDTVFLPMSGVMDSAVFWYLVEESVKGT